MTAPPRDRLLRLDDAALLLGVHPKTVRRLVTAGKLQAGHVTGRRRALRVSENSVYRYMQVVMEVYAYDEVPYAPDDD